MSDGYNGNFKNDFDYATELGKKLLPILNSKLKRGYIVETENLNDIVSKWLDIYSGIDGLLMDEKDVSGIALRIQEHSSKNWETFTIRYERSTGSETEYIKRKRQIYNKQCFYPHYTCQAYFSNEGELLGGAFCLTKDLYDVLLKNEPFTYNKTNNIYLERNNSDNNIFIVVPFKQLNRKLIF